MHATKNQFFFRLRNSVVVFRCSNIDTEIANLIQMTERVVFQSFYLRFS